MEQFEKSIIFPTNNNIGGNMILQNQFTAYLVIAVRRQNKEAGKFRWTRGMPSRVSTRAGYDDSPAASLCAGKTRKACASYFDNGSTSAGFCSGFGKIGHKNPLCSEHTGSTLQTDLERGPKLFSSGPGQAVTRAGWGTGYALMAQRILVERARLFLAHSSTEGRVTSVDTWL